MSRSNPHDNAPNPATRWFEWNGADGRIRYYNKDEQKEIEIPVVPPHKAFKFLVLDELACISGFHKPSKSRIFSNDVRDTRQSVFVVKSKKEGILVEGAYREIKDRVVRLGGGFTTHLYIAFKADDGMLAIGSLHLRGAALGQWMDFRKANRSTLYKKAVSIAGFKEDTSGRITFRMPVFSISDTSPDTDKQAVALDQQLQAWIEAYLKRNTRDQVDVAATAAATATHVGDDDAGYERTDDPAFDGPEPPPITDDDIPF